MTQKSDCCNKCVDLDHSTRWHSGAECECHTQSKSVEGWEGEFNSFFQVRMFDRGAAGSWNPPSVFTMKNFIESHLAKAYDSGYKKAGEGISTDLESLRIEVINRNGPNDTSETRLAELSLFEEIRRFLPHR